MWGSPDENMYWYEEALMEQSDPGDECTCDREAGDACSDCPDEE